MRIVFLVMLSFLTACVSTPPEDKKPELSLKAASFSDLSGWGGDDFKTFVPAFTKSCERILKAPADKKFGALENSGLYGDWQTPCREFFALGENPGAGTLKTFFESRFTPHQVLADDKPEGLFTGYYEASLRGSREKNGPYQTPLYARADDLIMVQLGEFREDLKGRRIAGRVKDGKLVPYESRSEIVAGDWPHAFEKGGDKVLVWVDDPVDAFFVQIQGSGVVQMNDGSIMRIGYAGQNGHVYYAIGRELIKRGELEKENVSLQSIRSWLEAHPDQADEIMNTNESYVFFKQLEGEGPQSGPKGGSGVALTAGRSLAVDRSLLSYVLPLWADIEAPIEGARHIQRMMIAQDTGGAIRGPVRGDVFWGYGEKAEALAGPMKSKGRYWILLPNTGP